MHNIVFGFSIFAVMKRFIYIIGLLFFCLNGFSQDLLFNTRHLSVEEGMLGRRAIAVVQDHEEFIWIGTNEGLNRYDGYRFEHFTKSSHGLNSNNIHTIGIDDIGDIWITYVSDRFILPETQIFRPSTGKIFSIKEKLGNNYKQEYQKLLLIKSINPQQIILTLPSDSERLFIYKDRMLMLLHTQNNRLIYSPNKTEILLLHKDFKTITKYSIEGKILDSIQLNTSLILNNIHFTQNGNLLFFGGLIPYSSIFYKKKSTEKIEPIFKSKTQHKYTFLQLGFWSDNKVYFEYQDEIVGFDISKVTKKQPQKLFFDKQNNLWIATNNGIIILSTKPKRFRQYLKDINNNLYDGRGIWANDKAVFSFSRSGSFRYHFEDNTKKELLASLKKNANPNTVLLANDSSFWVGTRNSKLINMSLETGNILKSIKGTTTAIWSLFEDKNGRIWIGQNSKGLYYFDSDTITESQLYKQINGFDKIEQGKIIQIISDKKDNDYLWLASQSGWYHLHLTKGVQHRFCGECIANFKIPANEIHYTHQDNDGVFWLATASSGLLKLTLTADYKIKNVEQFTITEGLSSNTLYAIFEDDNGSLWMSSNNGINRFNKKTYEIQVFLEEDGLPHYEFNRLSSFQRKDGMIFFGTLNGIVSFHPKNLSNKKDYNVPLKISKCEKYSDDIDRMVNVTTEVLSNNKIVIQPNERLMTLSVSIQNYAHALKTKYIYRINGLQKEFISANKNEIVLSGLPYGNYILEVKAKSPDGRFSKHKVLIPLIVKCPFYFQLWFILLSIIVMALFIWQLFQVRTQVLKARKRELEEIVKDRTAQLQQQATQLQKDKDIIEIQAQKLRSLDKMKSRFFANISHELRTPLTLILNPIRSILKRQKTDNRDFTSAKIIEQNAEKLLKRINEILDLTKLEAQEMQLKPQPTAFYPFIKRLVASFEGFATEKEQNLTFDYQLNKDLSISLDRDKYEHIFNNYLSNAIKFTPKGGKIHIQLSEQQKKFNNGKHQNQIILSIYDNGQGIAGEDLSKVFDRFYQSKNGANSTNSSGIGLALTREIAQLMKGNVYAESELEKGSRFYFEMPFLEELGIIHEELEIGKTIKNPIPFEHLNTETIENVNKSTILLVEDNTQLRNYIQLILQEKYNIITAENGKRALELLQSQPSEASMIRLPSTVISDIMMPVMDGFELLEKLKTSDEYRHIPVVMLTARSNAKDKLKALRIGVDDYILKPFDEEELITRIDNLIRNGRERGVNIANVKEKIAVTNIEIAISSADMTWLKKAEKQLQQEVNNSKFNIDSLAEMMQLSRSHLHRKIKTITGLTPNKYFREIKLQTAREILEKGEVQTVNEVCYAVGFDTPKYFSKVYEQRFGKRPISYLR